MTNDQIGRILANSYEDMQKIRTSTMHQIRDVIRRKAEGLKANETEEKKEEKDYTKTYADENLPKILDKLVKQKKIKKEEKKYMEKVLKIAIESQKLETMYKQAMEQWIKGNIVYNEFRRLQQI